MKALRLEHAFSALALVFACAGASSTARADFKIRIDCHGAGGLPSWAPTTNAIQVQVKIGDGWHDFLVTTMNDCSAEDSYTTSWGGPQLPSAVEGIRIYTSGANTFWIDELSLLTSTGTVVRSWGVENNFGFCVSTDPNDGAAAECFKGVALNPYYFNR